MNVNMTRVDSPVLKVIQRQNKENKFSVNILIKILGFRRHRMKIEDKLC